MTHEDDDEFDTKIEPWFVDYHTNAIEQYPVIRTHGRVIARITGGRGMEVAETYAYLFVAAREMQEALEEIVGETTKRICLPWEIVAKARAALAKSYPPKEG